MPIMNNRFFEQTIPNSPYEYPSRHWEQDGQSQLPQRIDVMPDTRLKIFISSAQKELVIWPT
jgi:hypothetical protein